MSSDTIEKITKLDAYTNMDHCVYSVLATSIKGYDVTYGNTTPVSYTHLDVYKSQDLTKLCDNVYKKITTMAKDLVATGEEIGKEFGVPIVNKRISVTPIALIGGSACKTPDDFVKIAQTLDLSLIHIWNRLMMK